MEHRPHTRPRSPRTPCPLRFARTSLVSLSLLPGGQQLAQRLLPGELVPSLFLPAARCRILSPLHPRHGRDATPPSSSSMADPAAAAVDPAGSARLVGGVDRMQQVISLARHPHIIVATPGRLLDHLTDTKGFSLSKIKYLVLDEADVLLDMEFEKSLDDILKVLPKERRTFLFSATMTDKVKKLQRACLRNPVKLQVSCKYSTVDTLREEFYLVPADDKDCCLVYVLNKIPGSMIMIFTETCSSSRLLALMLRNLGFEAIYINGKMSQDKRLGALNRFKSKGCNIITCTDVASRGLDIRGVDVVINYDIPSPKSYVHRVGRTARAGQSGYAMSLVNQYEVLRFKYIEKLLGKEISKSEVNECELKILKECVYDSKRIALKVIKDDGCKRPRSMRDDEDGMEGHDPFSSRRSLGLSINRSRRSRRW